MNLFEIYKSAIDTYFNRKSLNFIDFKKSFSKKLRKNGYKCRFDEKFSEKKFGTTDVAGNNIFAAIIALNGVKTYTIFLSYSRRGDGFPTGILKNFTDILEKNAPKGMQKAFLGVNISSTTTCRIDTDWKTYTDPNKIYPETKALKTWWKDFKERAFCNFYVRLHEDKSGYHILLFYYLNDLFFYSPEEISAVNSKKFSEGKVRHTFVNSYERNEEARQECIDYHGARCSVCDFEFSKVYGKIGKGFIHVHHLKPIADIGEEYEVDPIKDLRPVCPNCHAMLHKKEPPYTIDRLKRRMKKI